MNIDIKRVKIFVTITLDNVENVREELRKSHPSEEPAIDIIPLIDESAFE